MYNIDSIPCYNAYTCSSQEFQAHKKQGSGFLSRVSDSLHNMSASYMMKNRPPEFAVMHDYITLLSDKLGVMDRISQRVSKEQNGKLNVFSPQNIHFTYTNRCAERSLFFIKLYQLHKMSLSSHKS